MNNQTQIAVEDLTAWRISIVQIAKIDNSASGQPRIESQGATAALIKVPEIVRASDYEIAKRFAVEPEYKAAAEALHKAIEDLHKAREVIIARKARELASLIYQDEISTIQKAVQAIGANE